MRYLITVLIAVIISCGITIGYHYQYVRPVDEAIIEDAKINKQHVDDLTGKQAENHMAISNAVDFLATLQRAVLQDTIGYRTQVGKAFGEVIVNFESAQVRLKTLERRHLEVIRALAVLQKKHWDPAKAAEASGLD